MSIGCLMTTKPFKKNGQTIRFTKEALEGACDDLNRNAHIPIEVDHNPSMMPVGRTGNAYITKAEGEWSLFSELVLNTEAERLFHPLSGTYIADLNVGGSSKKICAVSRSSNSERIEIGADRTDFEHRESWDEFVAEVEKKSMDVTVKEYGRNAIDPMIGYLCIPLGIWTIMRIEKFARHVIDETMRKVGDELSDKWSNLILDILSSFEKSSSKKVSRYHVLVTISGEVDIVFILEREKKKYDDNIDSFKFSDIASVVSCYSDIIENASEITLIQSNEGVWRFSHVKLKDGNIVGDWKNYERSVKRWKEIGDRHGNVSVSPAGKAEESVFGASENNSGRKTTISTVAYSIYALRSDGTRVQLHDTNDSADAIAKAWWHRQRNPVDRFPVVRLSLSDGRGTDISIEIDPQWEIKETHEAARHRGLV